VQTQSVLAVDAFADWADLARSRGVFERMFVLAGVAVPRSVQAARYMRDHLPGVRVPGSLITALEEAAPDDERLAVDLTAAIVGRLRAVSGVAGIHLMGLGRLEPIRQVVVAAGLFPRPAA